MKDARIPVPLRFLGGVILALATTLVLFYGVMRPPAGDLRAMATFLAITATLSLAAGYIAYRGGWLSRSPRLSWTLLGIWGLSGVLTFLNVWLTARLMFASYHDLMLATLLLIFAGGIAMALGYFLTAELTQRMQALGRAAGEIAAGRLETRVSVVGRDEMAALAHSFNEMASQLAVADRKQRELEALRRDLIAWAGHDLRTPLASVQAILEALADGVVDDPATHARYLALAQRDIRELAVLIDDLFELAQLDAGGMPLACSPNSITDLISDTIESFSTLAAQQGVTLTGAVTPGADPLPMDVAKIGRVLDNLVGNAIRHTPPGGRVEVRAWRAGDVVRVAVQDTGHGIAPEDLARVFERFYRGDKSRSRGAGGAGLGLAIAKGIVEAHGGQILAESPPGQGAQFTFWLPGA